MELAARDPQVVGRPCGRRRVGRLMREMKMNARAAGKEIPDYIRYYNTRRRHSALGYLTPAAHETMISQGAHVER